MAGAASGPSRFDWGVGRYERTAEQLAPASVVVVERAAPRISERVLDLGCGTGNAALLAAARGAVVTGVDPAARLLAVGRARAAGGDLDVSFVLGDAAAVPMDTGSVDAVLSVFGVIFAPDPVAAAAELARVTARHGRVVLSAWVPEGPISQMARMARATSMAALGAPEMPPPFAWHDNGALSGLLAPHGFSVETEEHTHVFEAASIDDYLRAEFTDHPLSVASRAMLAAAGKSGVQGEIAERAREIITRANENPDGFSVRSSYVVAVARRA